MARTSAAAIVAIIALVAVSHMRAAPTAGKPIALVGGTLIDGSGGAVVRNSVVLLRQERIEKLGTVSTLPVPQGYERISTEGMTVLPGLWDPHVHLIYANYPDLQEYLKKYGSQLDTIMPVMAEQFLLSGVTSIRDLGAPLGVLNVKKRIAQGDLPGPTIYAAGPFLTTAGFGPHSVVVTDEAEVLYRVLVPVPWLAIHQLLVGPAASPQGFTRFVS